MIKTGFCDTLKIYIVVYENENILCLDERKLHGKWEETFKSSYPNCLNHKERVKIHK